MHGPSLTSEGIPSPVLVLHIHTVLFFMHFDVSLLFFFYYCQCIGGAALSPCERPRQNKLGLIRVCLPQ